MLLFQIWTELQVLFICTFLFRAKHTWEMKDMNRFQGWHCQTFTVEQSEQNCWTWSSIHDMPQHCPHKDYHCKWKTLFFLCATESVFTFESLFSIFIDEPCDGVKAKNTSKSLDASRNFLYVLGGLDCTEQGSVHECTSHMASCYIFLGVYFWLLAVVVFS